MEYIQIKISKSVYKNYLRRMKHPDITLRAATVGDLNEMRELYRGTISTVCANDYDEAQRAVWASTADNAER